MDHFTTLSSCLLFLLLLLPLILFSRRKRNDAAASKLPPGPPRLPIIGNLHQIGHLPHHSMLKLSRKHGPLMYLKIGSIPTYIASSSDVAKQILKTYDQECCNEPFATPFEKLSYNFSDMAFAPYGEQWRDLRKISNVHFFGTKKLASFRHIRREEAERMVNFVSSRCGSEIQLNEEALVLLANNITCRCALGKGYYSLGTSDGRRLQEILSEAQALFTGFFFADVIPALGWLDIFTGMRGRLENIFRSLDEIYQKVIDDHLEHPAAGEGDRDEEDVIHAMLDMRKTMPYMTDDHIKGMLMNIFIGGSESPVAIIEWTMAELMRRPEAMKRAQDEVRGVAGSKGKIDESDLDRLPFVKSLVKEIMRFHVVGAVIPRETIQRCKINGYDIPAKTKIIINVVAIARDPDVWDKPDDFIPERFMDSPIDYTGHDFQFIPFGAGRRICPGMQFGILVILLGLTNLLYHFDWEMPKGMSKEDIDMSETPGIKIHMKTPLRLVPKKYYL